MSSIRSVFSLLLTTALLLAGHGLHMTFLPLRASELGLSADWVGFSGGAYFSGFVWGALVIPPIIARVGHIRSFTALMATFLCSFLLLSLTSSGLLWVLIRFALGAAMCGAYTVIESWLADQSEPEQHGRIFSIYTLVVLAAMAAGQYLLQIMPENPLMPFITVALLVGFAIIPVSLTRSLAPAPVPATRFNFGKLYRRSHTAFAGALGSGMIMGSFWTLGAIYALNVTQDASIVPTFVAATIIGGAVAQYPIGIASDSIDRRFVLAALCALCCVASLLLTAAQSTTVLLSAAVLFGVGGSSLYAVSLAKAADNSRRDEFLTIGSSVLLLNALGAAIGSFLFGWIMRAIAPEALFFSVAVVSGLVGLYISLQPRGDSAVEVEDQSQFVAATSAMAPAALAQDPRNDQEPITISPEPQISDDQD